jgi:hypothetical protein
MHPWCGSAPGRCPSWTLTQADVAGPDLDLRKPLAPVAPARHLACTAIVLPLGMRGRPLWQAVAGAAMVRPAEVHVCLASRRSSLSLAAGPRSGPALVETSKTVEGGTST